MSRSSSSKSLYIPSATRLSTTRSNEPKVKYNQEKPVSRKSDVSRPIEPQKIVILEKSPLADKVERLLAEDVCWMVEEMQESPIKPLKVLDAGLQSSKWDYSFHSNYDFAVIGVIGFSGAGKSTILSKLAGDHLSPFTSNGGRTTGLDLYITPERVILLDSQPIMSKMVLDQLKAKKLIPASFSRRPHIWNEILSKRLTALLWSVCDVLLVVLDDNSFAEMLEFLETVDNRGYSRRAKVVFVYNKCFGNTFRSETYQKLINDASSISGLNWKSEDSCNLKSLYPKLYANLQDSNLFLLPCFSSKLSLNISLESLNVYRRSLMAVPNDFHTLFKQFRSKLMSTIPLKNSQTEREWFRSFMEIWEEISKIKWPISN